MSQAERPNSFFKFSNMAIQMGLVIGLSAWGGQKLDSYSNNQNSLFTIICSLLGIAAAMYLVLKDFIKPKK